MRMDRSFRALQVDKDRAPALGRVDASTLAQGDVWIRVAYSSLNYKDALAVTGRPGVVRRYPLIPGIDLAGEVVQSDSPAFAPGDQVLVTGYGIGEEHPGGFAELARVAAPWVVPLPGGLTPRDAMVLGTAGLTAMLAVEALERHGALADPKPPLVTGASGGVGSLAVAVLSAMGHPAVASSGRPEAAAYLGRLGAGEVIGRIEPASRPLSSQRWGGAVDVVGGDTLAAVLACTAHGGAVAACGLAGSSQLCTTVFPFILRGVALLGIDSARCPYDVRVEAWNRLARLVPPATMALVGREITLDDVVSASEDLLAGRVRGRVVVNVGG